MAFDLPFYMIESNDDAKRISRSFAEAERVSRPVVVLVADEVHGLTRRPTQ